MIEREKEKEYNISNSKYQCNCGKEVLNKDKEEHESNGLNHLYYRKGNINNENDYLRVHPENNKMHYTDYSRVD